MRGLIWWVVCACFLLGVESGWGRRAWPKEDHDRENKLLKRNVVARADQQTRLDGSKKTAHPGIVPLDALPQASSVPVLSALPDRVPLSAHKPPPRPDRPPRPNTTCKTTVGDSLWPPYETWKQHMPGVTEVWIRGSEAHPNYFLTARSIGDVQTAVSFVDRYNIRLSVISSGLDYLGRQDVLSLRTRSNDS
jgi:hypothetical protein